MNSTDEIGARNNSKTSLDPALVDDAFDFNRDGFVNATDQILARSNSTTLATALDLIAVPAGVLPMAASAAPVSLVDNGIAAGLAAPEHRTMQLVAQASVEVVPRVREAALLVLEPHDLEIPSPPQSFSAPRDILHSQEVNLDDDLYDLIAADLVAYRV